MHLLKWDTIFDVQGSVHRKSTPKVSNKSNVTQFVYICKLLYMFRVDPPLIIRSTTLYLHIWYLSNRYCYLPLSSKGWDWIPTQLKMRTKSWIITQLLQNGIWLFSGYINTMKYIH